MTAYTNKNSKDPSFSGRSSNMGSGRKAELSKRPQKPWCKPLRFTWALRRRKTVLLDGEEEAAQLRVLGSVCPLFSQRREGCRCPAAAPRSWVVSIRAAIMRRVRNVAV